MRYWHTSKRTSSSSARAGSSLCALLVLAAISGCSTVPGGEPVGAYEPHDPHESVNRPVYRAFDALDRRILQPVARGYRWVMPNWAEQGVANFFANLRDVDGALNALLQGKPAAAAGDLTRVVINSTIGIGGLIDVASDSGIDPSGEDFGQTLAVWGVTRSRYLYLPPLGPSTVRDAPGQILHGATPGLLLGGGYAWWVSLLDLMSTRAEALPATDARDAAALDPYAFTRDAYYQRRKYVIYDGHPPMDDFFDEFDDE